MCGRFTLTSTDPKGIGDRFGVLLGPEQMSLLGRFNAAPGQEILTVSVDPERGTRSALPARWGLVPAWADDLRTGYRMINAREERVFESRAYGPLARSAAGRCLIPADGFYEWLPAERGRAPKRPVRFTVDGGKPFALAGLVTEREWEGGVLRSTTILTTEANEVVESVHDRMPVILEGPAAEDEWLTGELDRDGVGRLCRPLAEGRVTARLANPALNKVGAAPEGPDLLESP